MRKFLIFILLVFMMFTFSACVAESIDSSKSNSSVINNSQVDSSLNSSQSENSLNSSDSQTPSNSSDSQTPSQEYYTIDINGENDFGIVETDVSSAKPGQTINVTVTIYDPDFTLEYVKVNNNVINIENGVGTFEMPNSNVVITYSFNEKLYSINVINSEGGTITVDRETAAKYELVTLTVTPKLEHTLKELRIDGKILTVENNQVFFTMPGNDVEITVVWQANSYNVILYSNDGNINSGNVTKYTYGQGANLPVDVTKLGYTFEGWYETQDLSGPRFLQITKSDIGAKVFYAKWTPISYTISYDANGGSGTTASSSHSYGVEKALTANAFTRKGYTFSGWATSPTGEKVYNNKQAVKNLKSTPGDIILYALWTPISYTISYNANGGTGTTASSTHTYDVVKSLNSNKFTKEGSTFIGWATSTTGSKVYNDNDQVKNLRDTEGTITLYAVWSSVTYTVVYNPNGGIGSMASSTHSVGVEQALTTNSFTKTGYAFSGWATSATGNKVYNDKQKVINLKDSAGSITLYAVWTPISYTVSYNANGGTGTTANSIHTYDVEKALTANAFTRTGYTFSGWATSATGAKVYEDKTKVTNLRDAAGTITLYAVWTPITYTVSYNGNGNEGGSTTSSTHYYDVESALTTNGFTKKGYTFSGWATTATGTKSYNDKAKVKNLRTTAGTVNLYALWTPISYTVTYNANSGTGTTANSSHTYGTAKALTTNGFTRTGYTFSGWATTATGAKVYDNKASVSNLTSTSGATVTLYAVWTPISYTVAYNANGGTGTTTSSTHTYGTAKVLTTNGFTRGGYTFSGWATSATGAKTYNDKQSVSNLTTTNGATVNLYAVWTPISYTVKYNANGGTGTTANSSHVYGTAKALTANAFTRTGYSFSGWATSSTGAKVYSDKQSVSNLTTTSGGTVNLYAVWAPITYTVKYNANGGSGTTASSTHSYGTAKALTTNGFTRAGYSFSGWATSSTGAKTYTDKQSVSNLTTTNGTTVNLYAVWTPITYTVKYNANGGTGTTSSSSHTYGTAKALTTNSFTRTGYIFAGWATTSTNGVSYTDKASVSNLTTTNGATVNLYAVWNAISYTIKYTLKNASIQNYVTPTAGASQVTSANYNSVFCVPSPTATGYKFIGWKVFSDTFTEAIFGATSSPTRAVEGSGALCYAGRIINDKSYMDGDVYFKNLTTTNGASVELQAWWGVDTGLKNNTTASSVNNSFGKNYQNGFTDFGALENLSGDFVASINIYQDTGLSEKAAFSDARWRTVILDLRSYSFWDKYGTILRWDNYDFVPPGASNSLIGNSRVRGTSDSIFTTDSTNFAKAFRKAWVTYTITGTHVGKHDGTLKVECMAESALTGTRYNYVETINAPNLLGYSSSFGVRCGLDILLRGDYTDYSVLAVNVNQTANLGFNYGHETGWTCASYTGLQGQLTGDFNVTIDYNTWCAASVFDNSNLYNTPSILLFAGNYEAGTTIHLRTDWYRVIETNAKFTHSGSLTTDLATYNGYATGMYVSTMDYALESKKFSHHTVVIKRTGNNITVEFTITPMSGINGTLYTAKQWQLKHKFTTTYTSVSIDIPVDAAFVDKFTIS